MIAHVAGVVHLHPEDGVAFLIVAGFVAVGAFVGWYVAGKRGGE